MPLPRASPHLLPVSPASLSLSLSLARSLSLALFLYEEVAEALGAWLCPVPSATSIGR